MSQQKHVVINALHTVTGGGLVYINKVLPLFAKEAERRGWRVTVVRSSDVVMVPKGMAVKEVRVKGFFKKMIYGQVVLPFWFWKVKGKAMVCNANYGPLLLPIIPIIHTNPAVRHGVGHKGLFSYGGGLYWVWLILLTRLSLWRAKAACTVAKHVVPQYARGIWRGLAQKVEVAPPGVDVPPQLAEHKHNRTVVAVGDVYPQKNYGVLIRAMKVLREQMPEVQLRVIGRALDAGEMAQLEALVTALGLEECVTFMGSLPHVETLQVVAEAQLLAAVSTVECFNMPVLEALAVGTPVVAGAYDFQEEVAGKTAVLVDLEKEGDTPAALAVALYGVMANPVLRRQLVAAGQRRAQEFTWARTAYVLADSVDVTLN